MPGYAREEETEAVRREDGTVVVRRDDTREVVLVLGHGDELYLRPVDTRR
jgi:hypothetical protein